jgi:solute carrier family 45 protein 1/2/4
MVSYTDLTLDNESNFLLSNKIDGLSTDENNNLYVSNSNSKSNNNNKNVNNSAHKVQEKPRRSKLQLFKMGSVYFGIEMLFSIEMALTVPILLKLKVSESIYSYVYFVSPLFGFLLQPMLGLMSDRCESPFGRRRPFILALSILGFMGITLILNGSLIGEYFGDNNLDISWIGVVLVGIGVTLLDFSADSCDSPLRAFLLDVCNPDDQDTGLNIHAFLGGIGASVGYILTAIEWKEFSLFKIQENQILFIISAVIFSITLVLTMTSAKEKPFKLHANNETEDLIFSSDVPMKNGKILSKTEYMLELVFDMPLELKKLLIAQTLGWLAFFSTTLFFTDFIGQSIYHGKPSAAENSYELEMYNLGTKMGSVCLLSFSMSSAISALVIEKVLLKKFSTKTLYLITYFLYIFSCVSIYFSAELFYIIPLCFSFGILMTTLTTLPYQMLSEFHQDDLYVNKSKSGIKRGLGIDCSLLCSCFFLAQTIVSSFMSHLTYVYGHEVILVVGGLFGVAGFYYIYYVVIFPVSNAYTRSFHTD